MVAHIVMIGNDAVDESERHRHGIAGLAKPDLGYRYSGARPSVLVASRSSRLRRKYLDHENPLTLTA